MPDFAMDMVWVPQTSMITVSPRGRPTMASSSSLLLLPEGILQFLPGLKIFLCLRFRETLDGKAGVDHYIIADFRIRYKINTNRPVHTHRFTDRFLTMDLYQLQRNSKAHNPYPVK